MLKNIEQIDEVELNYEQLNKELDKVKSTIFLEKNSGFFGSLLCSANLSWDTSCKTAKTNGSHIVWNPYFFLRLDPEVRATVLMHELRHISDLHILRRGNRNPKVWNWATDIFINNSLELMGFKFNSERKNVWIDPVDGVYYDGKQPEDIYDDLIDRGYLNMPDFDSDLGGLPTPEQEINIINAVIQAEQQAKAMGQNNPMDGNAESFINNRLKPKIKWEDELMQFCTQLLEDKIRTWQRPNRRIHFTYLPSYKEPEGALEHLMYFIDVSCSISVTQAERINSELFYVKNVLQPKKLTMVQFSTRITNVTAIEEEDSFSGLTLKGRGGTSLEPVRDYILGHSPTAAIIFSDLECIPMNTDGIDTPMLWIVLDNPYAEVNAGKKIHIEG